MAVAAPAGATTLISEQVVGLQRICTYRAGTTLNRVESYRVGVGQPCPAYPPMVPQDADLPPHVTTQLPAPDTATLVQARVKNGRRECVFREGSNEWTMTVDLDLNCAMTAGLMQKQLDERDPRF